MVDAYRVVQSRVAQFSHYDLAAASILHDPLPRLVVCHTSIYVFYQCSPTAVVQTLPPIRMQSLLKMRLERNLQFLKGRYREVDYLFTMWKMWSEVLKKI